MKTVCFVVLTLLVAAGVNGATNIAVGGDCGTGDTCASPAICDPLQHKCAFEVGDTCNGFGTCVSGAICFFALCDCDTGFTLVGKACAGDRKVDGKCTGTDQGDCEDANAECTDDKCKCKTGYTGPAGGSCAEEEENSAGDLVVSLTSLMLAAIAGLMMRA